MKAFRIIVCILLILFAVGLLGYQGFVAKNLTTSDVIKAVAIIVGAIAMVARSPKPKVVNKKAVYEKAYGEFIQNVFYEDPRLEKKFYDAVHDYNQNRFDAALSKLKKLRSECQRSADLRAVHVFSGLCLDDMGIWQEALKEYEAAARIRPCATLLSNMGLCHFRLGNHEQAEECYKQALSLDSENAFVLNNLSALYFRRSNYPVALSFAKEAIKRNNNMPQALSTAAICCALLGDKAGYEDYYRRAVSAGYDGVKIKHAVAKLNPNL